MSEPLTTDEFDYDLPDELIAQHPAEPRDSARLLVDNGPGVAPSHRHVADLADVVDPGDLLVVNDTRVTPARLYLQRTTGGQAEVLLLERRGHDQWEAMVRPSRKLRDGELLTTIASSEGDDDPGVTVEIGERLGDGTRLVRVLADDPMVALATHGVMPLPPYITESLQSPERYQTIYARNPGSAAAPTAGLHFTDDLMARLAANDVTVAKVELVVGLDTFRPITGDNPRDHVMHSEVFNVSDAVMAQCAATRAAGGKVIAVGTTTVRALESAAAGRTHRTDIFIARGHQFAVVDRLMTNFHLPRTTLLCMIDAFVGRRWRSLYDEAIRERYRFLSFGDAMLLSSNGSGGQPT
jgi:S-adenosylmethionine:tRNA ribosyltransferase-isomerase